MNFFGKPKSEAPRATPTQTMPALTQTLPDVRRGPEPTPAPPAPAPRSDLDALRMLLPDPPKGFITFAQVDDTFSTLSWDHPSDEAMICLLTDAVNFFDSGLSFDRSQQRCMPFNEILTADRCIHLLERYAPALGPSPWLKMAHGLLEEMERKPRLLTEKAQPPVYSAPLPVFSQGSGEAATLTPQGRELMNCFLTFIRARVLAFVAQQTPAA